MNHFPAGDLSNLQLVNIFSVNLCVIYFPVEMPFCQKFQNTYYMQGNGNKYLLVYCNLQNLQPREPENYVIEFVGTTSAGSSGVAGHCVQGQWLEPSLSVPPTKFSVFMSPNIFKSHITLSTSHHTLRPGDGLWREQSDSQCTIIKTHHLSGYVS